MPFDHLAILLAGSAGAGLLLYAPFYFWFRSRKRARKATAPGQYGRSVPLAEGLWSALCVALLFLGFAQEHLSPATWFGAQMTSSVGKAVFTAVLIVAVALLRGAWVLLWVRRRERSGHADAMD